MVDSLHVLMCADFVQVESMLAFQEQHHHCRSWPPKRADRCSIHGGLGILKSYAVRHCTAGCSPPPPPPLADIDYGDAVLQTLQSNDSGVTSDEGI